MSSNPRRGKKGPSPNPEECPKIPMFLNPEGDKMSEVKWTEEQSQAIHEKGSNILVAAAAGSGKTAVLVERIINKIIEEEIDIDKLLVVTFTNAAASEMRERILNAIYKKIEEEPTNLRLQKQITLLNKSNICTIHSFCLDVIRNNFYEINISPNFRIGDTAEIELLKEEVLDELFEDLYLKEDEGFLKLLEIYTSYKDDEPLKDIVKSIYNFIQSAPFPEKWLAEKVKLFDIDIENTDFAETVWGKIILNNYKECIEENILGLKKIKKELEAENELEKFSQAIRLDIENLESLLVNLNSWDKSYELAKTFSFVRWPSSKKINSETPALVKEKRDMINAKFKKLKDSIFIYTSAEVLADLKDMYEVLNLLQAIILKFNENYKKAKLERNIIDFNDIEHLALKILIKDEDGKYVPSEIAKKYQDKFEEIAIDEYQDSNMVQEYILTSISKGNNIFMVGDVKQSIYKFRQAMPELFLNKYKTYKLKKEKTEADDLKIQLFKNFRSRKNILDTTNIIFQEIMSKDLGDVDYNEDEYLNLGANYEEPQLENIDFAGKTEINIINLEDTTKDSQEDEEDNVKTERIENSILEARYVAQKINELINSNYYVLDKKEGYRIQRDTFQKRIYKKINERVVTLYEPDPADNGNRPGIYTETKEPDLYPGIEQDLKKELERLGWYADNISNLKPIKTTPGGIYIANTPARVVVQTFSQASLKKLRQSFSRLIPMCYLVGIATKENINKETYEKWINFAIEQGAVIIGPSIYEKDGLLGDLLKPWMHDLIKEKGLLIHAYTFKNREQIINYFDMADGFFTNKADDLLSFLLKSGKQPLNHSNDYIDGFHILDALGY